MSLADIIARLEKATGPDREIDGAIALSVGWTFQKMKGDRHAYYREPGVTDYYRRGTLPDYTASIDAALTLVPPWSWRVGNLPSGRGFADLGTQASLQCVEGATPPLALCIAALKARNEQ